MSQKNNLSKKSVLSVNLGGRAIKMTSGKNIDGILKGEMKGKIIKEGNVVLIVVSAAKLIEMNTNLLKWYISKKNIL